MRWSICSAALRCRRTREILRLPLSLDSAPGPKVRIGSRATVAVPTADSCSSIRSCRPSPHGILQKAGQASSYSTCAALRLRLAYPFRPPPPAPIRAALTLPSASYCLANTTLADMSEIHRPLKTSP
jgi:hypothetical protein